MFQEDDNEYLHSVSLLKCHYAIERNAVVTQLMQAQKHQQMYNIRTTSVLVVLILQTNST